MKRKIAIIGLGYVGLPVALAFAKKYHCLGFDINKERIKQLQNRQDITLEVSNTELEEANIEFTSNILDLAAADFFIIAVPTPVTEANKPDFTMLESASALVAKVLKKGDIVVYESTVYPGATEEICVPVLADESKLLYNQDFFVGYSPERINPGDKVHKFTNIRKIVSASSVESLMIISKVYETVVSAGIHPVSSIKVAEAAKVIENTQRDINIAFMNELSIIFDRLHIDTSEVIEAASSKWNFLPFKPGLVGGHCIGVDPYYLTYKAESVGYIPQVILSGRRINDNMARYVARRTVKEIIKSKHNIDNVNIAILGLTFKENCPDLRNSKVFDIIAELQDYGIQPKLHDPVITSEDAIKERINLCSWKDLKDLTAVIIAVSHDFYRNLKIEDLMSKIQKGAIIIDVKSVLPKQKLSELGYNVWRL
jgi:UDP-N-acetyl-D-galactosamine dehydrogenase